MTSPNGRYSNKSTVRRLFRLPGLLMLMATAIPGLAREQAEASFFGSLSLGEAVGDVSRHGIALARLGGEYKRGPLRLFGEFALTRRQLQFDLKRGDSADPLLYPEATRSIERNYSYLDVRDFFLEWTPTPDLVLEIGRRKVVWGQMAFAPADIMLPLESENRDVGLNRANFRIPQDLVALSWYPSDRVALQLYYFPTVQTDPLFEELQTELDVASPVLNPDIDSPQDFVSHPIEARDLTDHEQYAARLVLTPLWGTFAVTLFRGYDSLFYRRFRTLHRAQRDGSTACDLSAVPCYYWTTAYTDLAAIDSFALELAIPLNDTFTWKMELHLAEAPRAIYALDSGRRFLEVRPGQTGALTSYYDRIFDDNAGSFYIPGKRQIAGMGLDITLENWEIALELLSYRTLYSGLARELHDAKEALFGASDDNQTAPVYSLAWHPGGDRSRTWGTGLVFFGTYTGITAYYTARTTDNFRWEVGVQALSRLQDDNIADVENENGNYELAEELPIEFHFTTVYDF